MGDHQEKSIQQLSWYLADALRPWVPLLAPPSVEDVIELSPMEPSVQQPSATGTHSLTLEVKQEGDLENLEGATASSPAIYHIRDHLDGSVVLSM